MSLKEIVFAILLAFLITMSTEMSMGFASFAESALKKDGFFFIAELSNNHLGDLARYKRLVSAAKDAGAHAVKIQTYSADSLCLEISKENHQIIDGPWAGKNYWDLYKSMEVPLSWSLIIRDYAESMGMPILSSPFSARDVRFLVENGFDMLKLASGEFCCPELVDAIITSGADFMASTGLATELELNWFSSRLSAASAREKLWCLFNCISRYPCEVSELDLGKYAKLAKYSIHTGLSDHSLDYASVSLSFAAGARVFEKHLTLSRSDGGPDACFSMEPDELKTHIDILHKLAQNKSISSFRVTESSPFDKDRGKQSFARSVYATKPIKRGEKFSSENIGSFRPSHSESAIALDCILGHISNIDLKAGDPVLRANMAD